MRRHRGPRLLFASTTFLAVIVLYRTRNFPPTSSTGYTERRTDKRSAPATRAVSPTTRASASPLVSPGDRHGVSAFKCYDFNNDQYVELLRIRHGCHPSSHMTERSKSKYKHYYYFSYTPRVRFIHHYLFHLRLVLYHIPSRRQAPAHSPKVLQNVIPVQHVN